MGGKNRGKNKKNQKTSKSTTSSSSSARTTPSTSSSARTTPSTSSAHAANPSSTSNNSLRIFTNNEIVTMLKNQRELGPGAASTVRKGSWNGKLVAVKESESQNIAKFRREKEFYERIKHRHIVTCFGYFEGDTKQFLVLEYMESTLAKKRFGLNWESALKILIQLTEAISHINSEYIIGDLKPDAILLDKNNNVKLADFNSVIKVETLPTFENPYYAAPEARGKKVYSTTDVYSIGIIMLELLCGKKTGPYPGKKELESESTHLSHIVRGANREKKFSICSRLVDSGCTGLVATKITDVGTRCTNFNHQKRPKIDELLGELCEVQNLYMQSRSENSD